MNDATGTTAYLSSANELATRLARAGREIFEVHYHGLVFGSWILVAGTRKQRVRLTWDARDRTLITETATFADSQSHPPWTTVHRRVISEGATAQVLAMAEEIILLESGAHAT